MPHPVARPTTMAAFWSPVVESSTMLYGPRPDNPNFLGEDHPLSGHADAHCVQNRVEVEQLVSRWVTRHPDAEVTAIELNGSLFDVLEAKQHQVERADFLEHHGEYDCVIMNPPFEKG